MIKEWTEQELLGHANWAANPFAVFLYTPLCGTCKLAERMLDIILTMEPDLPIYKSNVNFLPRVVQDWQITSIPCIVILKDGPDKKLYSMKSVDDLYRELKPLAPKKPYKLEEDKK
jgi:thioredoxin-like negative regulator of GroEL